MPKLRILIFTYEYPPFPGGIARYVDEIAKAAVRAGHEVHVVAPSYDGMKVAASEDESVIVHREGGAAYGATQLPRLLLQVLTHLRAGPWDYVHAADVPYSTVLACISRFRPLKFQSTAHGTDILSLRTSKSARLLCSGNPYKYAHRTVCNSKFTRSLLHQVFPVVSQASTLVTHLGVNPFWFQETTEDDRRLIRAKLGVPESKRIVLTVARLDRRKGHLATFDALEHCERSGLTDLHYVIVGGAGEREYEAELRERAGNSSVKVTFAGVLSEKELRVLYSGSAVFCMPGLPVEGRVEGFGLAYLEAAACYLPSIGTADGGVSEVIDDGITGILVPVGSPNALNKALRRLLSDDALRARMGNLARSWALKFTWAKCAALTYGQTMNDLSFAGPKDPAQFAELMGLMPPTASEAK